MVALHKGLPSRSEGSVRRKRRTPAEIRERLIQAAHEEFASKGFAGATTAAIAKRADVAEIQMFRYFPSKANLFQEALFAPLKDHFRAFNSAHSAQATDADAIWQNARVYTVELLDFLKAQAPALIALLNAQAHNKPLPSQGRTLDFDLQVFFDEIAAVMSQRAGQEGPSGTIVRIAFGALLGCITYKDWLFVDGSVSDPTIDRAICDFILAGIAPHSDLRKAETDRS